MYLVEHSVVVLEVHHVGMVTSREIVFQVIEDLAYPEKFQFQERVRALQLEDFTHWLSEVGLEIKAIYGDYTLSDYNPLSSSRLILIVQ